MPEGHLSWIVSAVLCVALVASLYVGVIWDSVQHASGPGKGE